jgi:hypothetical protein
MFFALDGVKEVPDRLSAEVTGGQIMCLADFPDFAF